MGKCFFDDTWLENPKYAVWLVRDADDRKYRCKICKKSNAIGTLGYRALDSHMGSEKHRKKMGSTGRNTVLDPFVRQPRAAEERSTTAQPSVTNGDDTPRPTQSMLSSVQVLPVGGNDTLRAEIVWTMRTVAHHHSYNSNDDVSEDLKIMFPDSNIVKSFTCGEDKTAYLAKFGIAPYIKELLINQLGLDNFVICFDESLNETTKTKQLDLHVRFWVNEGGEEGLHVKSRFLGSQFMGHGTAADLLQHFKATVDHLNRGQLFSVSMDGPNVNWKFHRELQKEQGELFDGKQLIDVGSCGLHTLNNSFKAGFKVWNMDKILRALHQIFHQVPARREDFTRVTKSELFPMSFCGHRWLENLPVAQRALEMWENIQKYVGAVLKKEVSDPKTASFDTLKEAVKDPCFRAKLHYFIAIANAFAPFLTRYQTDIPMVPFIGQDMKDLIKGLLRRFIKKEHYEGVSSDQLMKLDLTKQDLFLSSSRVEIGMGAESELKELVQKGSVSQLRQREFKEDCMKGLSAICKKLLEKCPLKYSTVQQLSCLNPKMMYRDPETCIKKFKGLLKTLLDKKQLEGGIAAGDAAAVEYAEFLEQEAKNEAFKSFNHHQHDPRVDVLLRQHMQEDYPLVWGLLENYSSYPMAKQP